MDAKDKNRFFAKVEKTPHGCWIWMAGVFTDGYGCFRLDGKLKRSHRVSFIMHGGTLTADMPWVLHSCHNPRCVNPDHLRAGTAQDNATDKVIAERTHDQCGQKNPIVKLSDENVREIFRLGSERKISQKAIGVKFGINQTGVSKIVRRKIWQTITQDMPSNH